MDCFPENWADQASVLLITVVFAGVSLMFYALIRGGTTALIVIALFGVLGVGEAHHWIEAIQKRAYDPGLITSFAYVWVGVMIEIEVGRELVAHRRQRRALGVAA